MDKVTKVSISGISFTLEENAYSILKEYLDRLNSHYKSNPNGREIVEGIEERIAELLVDAGGKSGVVSQPMVHKVLDIVGKPEEIYSDGEEHQDGTLSPDNRNSPKKRFYRNPDDKVIAGVCGGLGAYFHQDPLWFRIGFVLPTVAACFTDYGWWNPFTFLLAYFIMCICIPTAATTAQKCAMRGESLSYEEIEKNAVYREEHNESILGNLVRIFFKGILIFFGLILLLVGFVAVLAAVVVLFAVTVAGAAIPKVLISAAGMALDLSPFATLFGKILLCMAVLLPIIAIIYGGLKLLFRMKTPKWRPGLIILLAWCLSVIGLIVIGGKISSGFRHPDHWEMSEIITPASDTIYVKFNEADRLSDKKLIADGNREEYNLAYADYERRDDALVATYPTIRLSHDTDSICSVDVSSTLFTKAMSDKERREKEKLRFFSFRNDTLSVDPNYFGKDISVTELGRELTLTVPENVKVIIPAPVYHQFENEFEHSDIEDADIKDVRKIIKDIKNRKWNIDINSFEWFTDDDE